MEIITYAYSFPPKGIVSGIRLLACVENNMAKRKGQPRSRKSFIELLEQPDRWHELNEESLGSLVALGCINLGMIADPTDRLPAIAPLYALFVERCHEEFRGQVEKIIVQSVSQGNGAAALLPFMIFDPDISVISTAALDSAVLCKPTEEDGPFTGPKTLLTLVEPDSGLGEITRAGILTGLVLLGDRRLLPLLKDCWRWLGPAGRQALAQAKSGNVTAGLIEFFLNWLEQTEDESDFGGVVGTLCHMPSYTDTIHDIERAFPAFSPDYPDGPVRVLRTWTFPQYYRRIRSRLKRIWRRESEPKLIPQIAFYWRSDR